MGPQRLPNLSVTVAGLAGAYLVSSRRWVIIHYCRALTLLLLTFDEVVRTELRLCWGAGLLHDAQTLFRYS